MRACGAQGDKWQVSGYQGEEWRNAADLFLELDPWNLKLCARGCVHMRSPNIWSRRLTRSAAESLRAAFAKSSSQN